MLSSRMQAATEVTPAGHTYKLTLFSSNKDNQGHVVSAESPDDIVRAYENPQLWHNELEVDADTLKNASRAVSAGVFNGTRAKANIVSANVLFLDFDDAYDQNAEQLVSELRAEGWLFALHTSTGSQFLDGGRCKLRLVMPLSEAVSAEDYRSVWAEMAAWAKERVGLVADSTKQGAESLMYLPMWLPGEPWQSRWHSWANLQADGAEPYMWFSVADAPTGGSTYEQHALERIANGVAKDATLVKYAYALGAQSAANTESDIAAEIARLWPLVSQALQRAERLPGGSPVKDWDAAARKFHQKFVRGVRARQQEAADAVEALRGERTRELREILEDRGTQEALRFTNKKKQPAARKIASKLGRLCAVADKPAADEAVRKFEDLVDCIPLQSSDLKKELLAAFAAAKLAGGDALELQVTSKAFAHKLLLDSDTGLPRACDTNVMEILLHDSEIRKSFVRNVRSEKQILVLTKKDGECVETHMNVGEGISWGREFLHDKYKMQGVQMKDWVKAVEGVDLEKVTSVYDPVVEYLDGLPTFEGSIDDARELVDTFLIRAAGVEDSEYSRAATRAMLLSAVHAARRPGRGADLMWIFQGEQGLGKTKILRALCQSEQWFGALSQSAVSAKGNASDQGRKKLLTMSSKWIVEVPEIRFDRSEANTWKEFVSQHDANDRLSYGKHYVSFTRRCIMVATTNETALLKDPTGNRRYLPLKFTRMVDLHAVVKMREQLWAAADLLWRAESSAGGADYKPNIPESMWKAVEDVQREFYDASLAEELLEAWTNGSQLWPDCDDPQKPEYHPLENLAHGWIPESNGIKTTPKVLKTWQIKEMLASRKAGRVDDLSAVMRRLGWKEVRSRKLWNDGSANPAWVHPSFQNLLG